ncbi:MAG: MFS transporter [Comamonadaceae bacterium]|nr:MFS transporter [Comamonadaceae bacterium]
MPAASPPPMHAKPLPPERVLITVLGFYMMLQAISTDLYLPSLPGLTRTFGVPPATVALTLSVFVLVYGTMQLVLGPVSDRYGRYPALVGGLALYAGASIAAAQASSIGILIGARAVQAVGCCGVVVAARAIVRDAYTPCGGSAGPRPGVVDPRHGAAVRAPPGRGARSALRLSRRLRRAGTDLDDAAGGDAVAAPGDRARARPEGAATAGDRDQLPRRAEVAPVPRLHAGRERLVRQPVRLHLRIVVRADRCPRGADHAVRAVLRLLRLRLPRRDARLPAPARPGRHPARAAARCLARAGREPRAVHAGCGRRPPLGRAAAADLRHLHGARRRLSLQPGRQRRPFPRLAGRSRRACSASC